MTFLSLSVVFLTLLKILLQINNIGNFLNFDSFKYMCKDKSIQIDG